MLETMQITTAQRIEGTIGLPGDKSISHRAAIIASLADGISTIRNFSTAEDCRTTLQCLKQLGVEIHESGRDVRIRGIGNKGFSRPAEPLDCRNSGTTMRLLAGVLVGQPFDSLLTGDQSLQNRPMRRIVEPLNTMGAAIDAPNDRPPIAILPAEKLRGIDYSPTVASAQVKSCILLAGLAAEGTTSVAEPAPTRDHTERMLRFFGANIEQTGGRVSLMPGGVLTGQDLTIPADLSAAAFFLVAAALLPGSVIRLPGVGLNPTRTAVLDTLIGAGIAVNIANRHHPNHEPVADLQIASTPLPSGSSIRIRGADVPPLIDEIPILAILGTQLDGGIEVRDAGELRYKESDRIAITVDQLRRMKADVEEFPDGFLVRKSRLRGAEIDPHGDHRIAMAFTIAALVAEGESAVRDADCVDISFPGFFETLKSVVR
jgi:3-phosphoshikimate 1-carboxyvinyltransferase